MTCYVHMQKEWKLSHATLILFGASFELTLTRLWVFQGLGMHTCAVWSKGTRIMDCCGMLDQFSFMVPPQCFVLRVHFTRQLFWKALTVQKAACFLSTKPMSAAPQTTVAARKHSLLALRLHPLLWLAEAFLQLYGEQDIGTSQSNTYCCWY